MPFVLVPLLALAALAQCALPATVELPPVGPTARIGTGAPAVVPAPVTVPSQLAARDPFAPPAAGAAGAAAAPPDPLGGARIAGVVQRGRQRLGVVIESDGRVRYLGLGGRLAGWQLVALTPQGARLARGAKQVLDVRYGAHPVQPRAPGAAEASEDE